MPDEDYYIIEETEMKNMSYKDHKYHLFYKTQFAERLTKGFSGGKVSDDGDWLIGGKGDAEMCEWVDFDADLLPQWLKDLGVDNCCLSFEEAEAITQNPNWSPSVEIG